MADLHPLARRLRRGQTDAERLLWSKLRARRTLGLKFRRQAPIGPYIVDFVCFEQKLVIELDGGGHGAESQRAYDERRTKWLNEQGFTVLRFWDNEVLQETESVLERIRQVCAGEFLCPPPPSSPTAGGGRQ